MTKFPCLRGFCFRFPKTHPYTNTGKRLERRHNIRDGYLHLVRLLSRSLCFSGDHFVTYQSVSLVTRSCPTICDPMNCSMPGLPVHHQLLEFTQTHVHRVSDAIQSSHPLLSPFPPALNPSQHQSLFQWVNSSHEVAKVLEFQLQHHSLQRNPRVDLL